MLSAQPFQHPGILHTEADFDRMRAKVNAAEEPYLSGWNQLVNNPYSQSGWNPRPLSVVVRGGTGDNVAQLYIDVQRAYQNALRWKVSGSTAHGDTARNILNAWSATLTTVTGNADRYLAAGLFGYQLANASEMMRGYPGFEVERMQDMLWNVFYKPLNERFLYGNEFGADHNDACIENYWANWDLCNMAAAVAISIFCDRRDTYEKAINYFKYGAGNGSIYHAVPYIHPGDLGQWQESGRDQGHTILGIGLMASICEMAWSQGDDLYGWADNRFMKAAEYVARYNNGFDVPFSTYQWRSGTSCALQEHGIISGAGRNEWRPVWEMIYNHYANRKGLSVPNIAARAANHRPEGGAYPGGHATTHDQIGFGTLSYTRPPGGGNAAALHNGDIGDSTYTMIARHSSKAIEAIGTGNGANVDQRTVSSSLNQQWTVTHVGGGEYRIVSVPSGRSMDIAGSSHGNGANVQIWDATNTLNQRFAFVPTSSGYFRMIPAHSGKSVDVLNSSTSDGANILQWKNFGGNNQQFRLVHSPNTPQSAPTVTITATNVQIHLSWTTSAGATGYTIKRGTANGGPYRIIATNITAMTYSDPGLSIGTTYYYIVAPVNEHGEGVNSSQASATTIPTPPLDMLAIAGNAQAILRWKASLGASSYQVKRSVTSGGPYTTVATVSAANYTDSSVTNGVTYYYLVTAVSSGGETNSSQVSVVPNPSGLVHHWKFDATSGTNAANSVSSPNGGLSAGATWAAGRFNNAVALNGSGGHVSFPKGVVSTVNDCTISGWFYLNSVSTWARVFDFGSGTGVNMFLTPRNGSGVIQFTITTTSGGQNITGSSAPSTGAWHHFAVTLSGTVGILYINGVEVGRNESMTLKPSSLGNTVQNWIGRSQWPDPYLNGLVDDFRIYNYGMNASQIAALASASVPSPGTPTAIPGNGQVSVNWTGLAEANGYDVKRATASGGPYTTVASGLINTSYIDTSVSNGTRYFYVISATVGDSESGDSGEAAATPNSAGLLHHWTLDESSGATAENSASSLDGALIGGASWAAGRVSNAVLLDGSSGLVSFPSGFVSSLTNYTVAGWFYLNTVGTWSRIFDFGSGTSSYMFLTPRSGSTTFRFAINTGSGEQQINGGSIPAAGAWHHFAVSVSGNVGVLYLNGAAVGNNSSMTLKPFNLGNSTQNWLGRSQFSADPRLNGAVDDFRIYTRGLSASEVAALASSNAPVAPMPPTGLTAAAGDLRISLNWTAAFSATSYRVKRSTTSGGPYTTIATGVTATNYTDTNVLSGVTCYYVVSGVSSAGEGAHSAETSEKAGRLLSLGRPVTASSSETANPAPNAVDGNMVTRWAASSGTYPQWWRVDLGSVQPLTRVLIYWESAASRSYKYRIETSNDDVNYTTVVNQTGRTATGNSADTFSASARYLRITVTGVSPTGGWASFYEVQVFNDTPVAPDAPTGLGAAAVSGNQIELAWNASQNASGYNLKRATTSGGPYTTIASNVIATSYTDTSVSAGIVYYYVVSAVNAGGESPNSTEVSASTVALEPPELSYALNGSQLSISWPATHLGWQLEAQTNAAGNGLTSEWFTVPGSTATNAVWVQMGAEEGSVFFRLANP